MAGYRPAYTLEEQKKILRFILEERKTHLLRGRQCWEELEEAGIVNRTWQSMKEHFRKQILPKLHHPLFGLAEDEIRLIKQGYSDSEQIRTETVPRPNRSPVSPSTSKTKNNVIDLADLPDSSDED